MSGCKYCEDVQAREAIMLFICEMSGGNLYLLRDQTQKGQCIYALRRHVKRMTELTDLEYQRCCRDIRIAAQAISNACSPDKLNYLVLGDLAEHAHIHLVPKYMDGPEWGQIFVLDRPSPKLLEAVQYQEIISRIKQEICNKLPAIKEDTDEGM